MLLPNHDSSSKVNFMSSDVSLSCAITSPDNPTPIPTDIIPVFAISATKSYRKEYELKFKYNVLLD